jgi:hypothetical protein
MHSGAYSDAESAAINRENNRIGVTRVVIRVTRVAKVGRMVPAVKANSRSYPVVSVTGLAGTVLALPYSGLPTPLFAGPTELR